MPVFPLDIASAADAARLHREGIGTGFLSSLGDRFLRQLYRAIPSCPGGFGFVWREEDGRVLGFIACTPHVGTLYKQVLWRRGFFLFLPLARFLLRPAVLKRMVQTLRYPGQKTADLPPAEVLSIAVDGSTHGRGIGKALMAAAIDEFARRGIRSIKVAVWAGNTTANEFYKRTGFQLAVTREHHGLPMNIYVRDTAPLSPSHP